MTDVVVAGAAGAAGSAVLAALRERGATAAAISHSDVGEARLREAGVERVVRADLTDRVALTRAFADADAVYAIPPALHPHEDVLIETAVAAAEEAEVERFVFHSVMHPHTPMLRNHMRKAKAEAALRDGVLPWTILQPSIFAQVAIAMFGGAPSGTVGVPFDIDSPVSVVDLADLAEVAAMTLLDPGHEYATYELVGETTTMAALVATIGRRRGIDLRAETIPVSAAPLPPAASAAPLAAADMISTFAHYDAHGFRGNPRVLSMLLGRSPRGVLDTVEREMTAD